MRRATHNITAMIARQSKDKHPERYCAHPKCLWRIVKKSYGQEFPSPCPKHPVSR